MKYGQTNLPLPLSLHVRKGVRTYADVMAKISRIDGLPDFLTHGAPRELRFHEISQGEQIKVYLRRFFHGITSELEKNLMFSRF